LFLIIFHETFCFSVCSVKADQGEYQNNGESVPSAISITYWKPGMGFLSIPESFTAFFQPGQRRKKAPAEE